MLSTGSILIYGVLQSDIAYKELSKQCICRLKIDYHLALILFECGRVMHMNELLSMYSSVSIRVENDEEKANDCFI